MERVSFKKNNVSLAWQCPSVESELLGRPGFGYLMSPKALRKKSEKHDETHSVKEMKHVIVS